MLDLGVVVGMKRKLCVTWRVKQQLWLVANSIRVEASTLLEPNISITDLPLDSHTASPATHTQHVGGGPNFTSQQTNITQNVL